MSEAGEATTGSGRGVSRRTWLGGSAVAGAALVGGAVVGSSVAAARDSGATVRREGLVLDVACDGTSFREQHYPNPPDPGDRRGTPFSVEGWIYPEGTVADGFLITEDGSIGRWFCSGFNVLSAERPEPHVNATANFVFGTISGNDLFPDDTLATFGLSGTFEPDLASTLQVIGGAGRYLGVSGQAMRTNEGHNNTVLFGPGVPALNFRYTFDLLFLV